MLKQAMLFCLMLFITGISLAQGDSKDHFIHLRATFYDTMGKLRFTDTFKLWYRDSMAIEEIHRININTDTANVTTVSYTTLAYRFIDLRRNRWYDYNDLSPNSTLQRQDQLP